MFGGNLVKQSNGLEFLYDHTGVFAVKYGGSTYFYRKDAQSNIVELLDSSGAAVVKYKYDAWGNCLTTVVDSSATEIANLNPFRYRSYYLDTETNLYFLRTRYYDPEISRFMTIDDIAYLSPKHINGLNLYAYCKNNPIAGYDPCGTWDWGTFWDIALTFGAAIAGIVVGIAVGAVAGVFVGILAGVATFGLINNVTNFLYYTFISDGVSNLTTSSYNDRYVNRWERLDYTKSQMRTVDPEHSVYNFNAWMYHSEYTFHAHAWWLLGWADGKGIPVISGLASSAKDAYVVPNEPFYHCKIK